MSSRPAWAIMSPCSPHPAIKNPPKPKRKTEAERRGKKRREGKGREGNTEGMESREGQDFFTRASFMGTHISCEIIQGSELRGPVYGLMVCRCHLEILNNF
jgi:hypothetical protein